MESADLLPARVVCDGAHKLNEKAAARLRNEMFEAGAQRLQIVVIVLDRPRRRKIFKEGHPTGWRARPAIAALPRRPNNRSPPGSD